MATVTLKGTSKSFSRLEVIPPLDLEIAEGEFVVLVGPSGCGKSTLLRMIAGLVPVSSGQVLIGGTEVTDMPPGKRRLAFVFQSYALYPHMNVARNIGFALETARMARAAAREKVERVAAMLKIDHLLDRHPRQLSGGQRQRVAIGRALVAEPEAFLFDEPLSNLDADLRNEMRFEIARLHSDVGTTMIYVTHDQTEAMTLADRIVILNHGRIEQQGAPRELYDRPVNRFVAGFLGSPRMNFAPVSSDGRRLSGPGGFSAGIAGGSEVAEIGLRPEALRVAPAETTAAPGAGRIGAVFEREEDLGYEHLAYLRLSEDVLWTARANEPFGHRPGTEVAVLWHPETLYLFGASGTTSRAEPRAE